jgi:dTDP-4-dehydrorhamnose reductase
MKKAFLVIGASGYLGQQVMKQLGECAIATHRTAPSFADSRPFDFYQDETLPIIPSDMTVIFTAAVEMNQPAAKLAAAMQRLLAQLSTNRFVYLSSDAIFSGVRGHYTEADPPDPVNDYGRNLLLCEQLVQAMAPDHCIIRPSYIYGFSSGELDLRLSRTRDRLLRGDLVVLYDDYYKCPLSVHEVAAGVIHLAQANYQGPIHLAGLRMSAYEFQRQAMNALGVDTTRLTAQPMPTDAGLMRDTSLDSARWWRMCNAQPLSIKDALQLEAN